MSYLLFMDESGHDHKNAPYEVRGGFALRDKDLWPLVLDLKKIEHACFGGYLHEYKSEIKGHKLLDKDRFTWAAKMPEMNDGDRRTHAISFLNKGTQKGRAGSPSRAEFTAYGQACLRMGDGIFDMLDKHNATVFAAVIPREVMKPERIFGEDHLRKDLVYLFERFFYFLEKQDDYGLLVMDETDKTDDRRFVRRLERYFTRNRKGLYQTSRIIPSPFFVSSEMAYPIQVADVCIYCINHGYRLQSRGMDAPVRSEIAKRFGTRLNKLRFKGEGYRDGEVFESYGIVYESDPYNWNRQ